ncbi:MAG TPA: adenylate/guanylate cyclase domain-containing protein [Stellaceae bacterium]
MSNVKPRPGFRPLPGIPAEQPADPGTEGERRQVTVLCADTVDFTAFSERAGEEKAYTLMQRIFGLVAEIVGEHSGSIISFTGDGLIVLFGVPIASEDAPLRACRAALEIHRRLAQRASEFHLALGLRPQMRIAISSGMVVLAPVKAGERVTAYGDPINLASRLQALADPGTVLMSEATHRLVEGFIESRFAGEHRVKGRQEALNLYRLDRVRTGVGRFDDSMRRGLSPFVGRGAAFELLEARLAAIGQGLRVVDIVADAGIGKSRLVHEFGKRATKENVFVLSGSCFADGQQTAFLPFIEVVRGAFRVVEGDPETQRKLEAAITGLGLDPALCVPLLLNLLGVKLPEGALEGLDGVLVGLRTRDVLQGVLRARCRQSPVVIMIEDMQWIDSASEELLAKTIAQCADLPLLLVCTRRPEYRPPWLDHPAVTPLPIPPLAARDIADIVKSRLGRGEIPDHLLRLVERKSEGNPLFAEEIVSYLSDRKAVQQVDGAVEFDPAKAEEWLPASVQSMVVGRVDRLSAKQKALLQAASVVGRRFAPDLIAAAAGIAIATAGIAGDTQRMLDELVEKDLVQRLPTRDTVEYAFKHALTEEGLYRSLLSPQRSALHLRVAEELERRNHNHLAEVAESLAHHFTQTNQTEKSFKYLALAGAKSLGVYSLDAAEAHLEAAIGVLERAPDCAGDEAVANLLVDYVHLLSLKHKLREMVAAIDRHMPRLDRLGHDAKSVVILHHYTFALIWLGRFAEAQAAQARASTIADHVGDDRSVAYALAGRILVGTVVLPIAGDKMAELGAAAAAAAARSGDRYIKSWISFVRAWEQLHRGRLDRAQAFAHELMAVGRVEGDPRPTGLALWLLARLALASEDYGAALAYAEECLRVALTPFDKGTATQLKAMSLVSLQRVKEGSALLESFRRDCVANDWRYHLYASDGVWGVLLVLRGHIARGARWIERCIAERDATGPRILADLNRAVLCQLYLDILQGGQRPPLGVLLRNLPFLIAAKAAAARRIERMTEVLAQNPQFDPEGFFYARINLIRGMLYKATRRRELARQHLAQARRIAQRYGGAMVTRIDTALADLG